MAIAEAERAVRIGPPGALGEDGDQSGHPHAHVARKPFGDGVHHGFHARGVRGEQGLGQLVRGIGGELLRGSRGVPGQQRIQLRGVGEHAGGVDLLHVPLHGHAFAHGQLCGQVARGLQVDGQLRLQDALVHLAIEVHVEGRGLLPRCSGLLGERAICLRRGNFLRRHDPFHARREAHQVRPHPVQFAEGVARTGVAGVYGIDGLDGVQCRQQVQAPGSRGPRPVVLFQGQLLVQRAQFGDPAQLADPLLVCIADAFLLVGVGDPQLVAGEHGLIDHRQTGAAHADAQGIAHLLHVPHRVAGDVALGVAGEAVDHGEVPLFHAVHVDGQAAAGGVGHVGEGRFRRTVVRTGIDAEEAEVPRMAGPHPVVGIATEVADATGRRTHQSHIAEGLRHDEVPTVAIVERPHHRIVAPTGRGLRHDRGGGLGDPRVAVRLGHGRIDALQHARRHILHPHDEGGREPRVHQFIGPRGRPETVLEVVLLHRAVLGDGAEPAMVVGEDEPLLADHLGRASSAEQHRGVLQAAMIDAVDVLGRYQQPLRAHVALHGLQQGGQPHAFGGEGAGVHNNGGKDHLHRSGK